MKKLLPSLIYLIVVLITLSGAVMDDNGRAGATGSPGETTCNTTNCHNSYTLNSGGGSISATCNMINWKYEPLTTYTISVKVARTGNQLFGVGVEILNSTNGNAGNLIITDAAHTQIKSRTISGVSRRNVVHTLNGGYSPDSAVFTFDWTSPDTTAGAITMYFAGNATNSNGNPAGDYVYTGTQLITPSSGTSIQDFAITSPLRIYPNPASDKLYIQFCSSSSDVVKATLYDLKGSSPIEILRKTCLIGQNNEEIILPDQISQGVYLLKLESRGMHAVQKVIIR